MHPVNLAQGVLATRLPNAIFLRELRSICNSSKGNETYESRVLMAETI